MTQRIYVRYRNAEYDALGMNTLRDIHEDLNLLSVSGVRSVDVTIFEADLSAAEYKRIAEELLNDPVIQQYTLSPEFARKVPWVVEVGFKPGVTDNVAQTTKEGIEDLLHREFPGSLRTAKLYLLQGRMSAEQIRTICERLLVNELIEYNVMAPGAEYRPYRMSRIMVRDNPAIESIELNLSDSGLMTLSRKRLLSLSLAEMKAIRNYFKSMEKSRLRAGLSIKSTDVELEMLAQTWSEHCKHKIFNAKIEFSCNNKTEFIQSLFKQYIRKGTDEISEKKNWLVSVFVDNAGIIKFDKKHNIVFKVETHNHPSAIEPYGGAITGIGGVNRDVMGTGIGASLLFNTDVFCFGPPDTEYSSLPHNYLHPKRIFKGVRRGVEHGGNKMGIPTVNGAIIFDKGYLGNPLVFCGTGGIMPARIQGHPSHKKVVNPGDYIVMVGGRIGKDGIHGATFSSVKLDEETAASPVQIGAPIVQKKMMDALLEARDRGLYYSITDNGAGGLSSSVGEMAQISGGCTVELEKAPRKYAGLTPWELWLSEAQERMTVAVKPANIDAFLELCRSRDVEATPLGTFNASKKLHLTYAGKTVAYLDMDFLHEGLPTLRLSARWEESKTPEPKLLEPADLTDALHSVLSSYNVCSKEWIIRQYDHEVQGQVVLKPLTGVRNDGPGDAAVVKPLVDSKKGIAVSNGINPRYGFIDPYWMAMSAVDEAIRNLVAVGGIAR